MAEPQYTVQQLIELIEHWEYDKRGGGPDPYDVLDFLEWLNERKPLEVTCPQTSSN
jgi:hypothetical protein